MSDAIELAWAKLPSFPHQHHEASNDALVAFLSFIPKIIFDTIKPFWEGYVFYNQKKVPVYKVDVVEVLLKETFNLNIEGVHLDKSIEHYPGSLIINKLLNISDRSSNKDIAKMAYKQRQLIIYSQIKRELWNLFLPSDVVSIDHNNDFKEGDWTSVRANKHEKEYDFDLTNGLLHYEDFRKNELNEFHTYHRVAKLKDLEELPQLMKLVMEYKKYGKNIECFYDFDFKSIWNEGFDAESFEPKRKNFS